MKLHSVLLEMRETIQADKITIHDVGWERLEIIAERNGRVAAHAINLQLFDRMVAPEEEIIRSSCLLLKGYLDT